MGNFVLGWLCGSLFVSWMLRPSKYPPVVVKHLSLRVAVSNPPELKGVKTDGSAAGIDQRIIKVW